MVYMEEWGMGCFQGRENMSCATLRNTPGGTVDVSPKPVQRHAATTVLAGCPFAASEDWPPRAAAAAVRVGSLHTGTEKVQNSPPYICLLLDTRFHLKKWDPSDSFNASNSLVPFLLQSVTGRAVLWVLVSGFSEEPSPPLLILSQASAVSSSAFKPSSQVYL